MSYVDEQIELYIEDANLEDIAEYERLLEYIRDRATEMEVIEPTVEENANEIVSPDNTDEQVSDADDGMEPYECYSPEPNMHYSYYEQQQYDGYDGYDGYDN